VNRVAPSKTANVTVTLANMAPSTSAAIDVEGSGGANGTATVTAGAHLAATGTATISGGTQTGVGNAGALRVRATAGGTVIGRSAGFTVAAWPANFTTSRVSDIDAGDAIGVVASNAWESDSGTPGDLDKAKRTERVDLASRDNPPFTSGAGTSATSGTSGYISGTASPTQDSHRYLRSLTSTSTLAHGSYAIVYRQNFLLSDERTGVVGTVVPKSGFTITHTVWWPAPAGPWKHQTAKAGAAVSVNGIAATAGAGSALSEVHTL
jgi:hypothetical protein